MTTFGGFVYNYYNAAWALSAACNRPGQHPGGQATGRDAAHERVGLTKLRQRQRHARHPAAGDPGPVPAPVSYRMASRRPAASPPSTSEGQAVRRRRRSAAGPDAAGPDTTRLREEEAPVDRASPGRQERRRHGGSSSRSVTGAAPAGRTRRADPPACGGSAGVSAVSHAVGRSISRSRDGERRGDPRPERRRQDHALQRHLRRPAPGVAARSSSSARTSRTYRPAAARKLGLARTYQQSRLLQRT